MENKKNDKNANNNSNHSNHNNHNNVDNKKVEFANELDMDMDNRKKDNSNK